MGTFNNQYYQPNPWTPNNNFGSLANAQTTTLPTYTNRQSRQSRRLNNNPWFGSEGMQKFGNIAGNVMAGVGAASEGIGGRGAAVDLNRELNSSIDYYEEMQFRGGETMIGGVPSYSGISDLQQEVGAIDPDLALKGMGMKGFSGGAAAGASIGGAVGAGVGLATAGTLSLPFAAIGSGVGALAGGIGGWISGMTKKGKASKAAYEAQVRGNKEIVAKQGEYNEDVGDYFDTIDQNRQENQGQRNYSQRMYGLGQYNDPFRSIV